MRPNPVRLLCFLTFIGSLVAAPSSSALKEAANDYEKSVSEAADQLVQVRRQVMEEKAPLQEAIRSAQDAIIELTARQRVLEEEGRRFGERHDQLEQEARPLQQQLSYSALLAEEMLATLEASLLAGEAPEEAPSLARLRLRLEAPTPPGKAAVVQETLQRALARLDKQLGGYRGAGASLFEGSNEVHEGAFAYLGPLVYFRSSDGAGAGLALQREGLELPVTTPLDGWDHGLQEALFAGETAVVPMDITGGTAVRLEQVSGGVREHLRRGGYVGYVILLLGSLALLTALLKLWDLRGLPVDPPAVVRSCLDALQREGRPLRENEFKALSRSVRELFTLGSRHLDKPREMLEELLFAHVLLLRNHHERRLPLLRVIAAAAPLLGLLGTVVGMIKTFTLITVLGTGNAAKLSSGISEALVTTELGLMVAIPTLLVYGYLSHQTERRLALLEQYSSDFLNAAS